MLERSEFELRKTGNPQDASLADSLVARIKERGDFAIVNGASATKAEVEFETPTVTEVLYNQTREALAEKGYSFVVAINPKSIGQLVADKAINQRFGYVNPSEKMRSNIPPQIEVAIDPNNFRIEGSNNKSTDTQIAMIRERETTLKNKLPEDLRGLISMIMPKHASVLAQLDLEHQKRTGKVLFTNWFGRTDDQTVPGVVAGVGRDDPASRLRVLDWHRGHGYVLVFAFPVVVLPRKLAV